jgi:hypothetical protein
MNLLFENMNSNLEDNNPIDVSQWKNFIQSNDINPSGVPRFGPSPLISATNVYYASKINKNVLDSNVLKFLPINSDVNNYLISTSVNHSPDDWTGYNPKVKSLFYYLNEKYLDDLRNKRALLLIDQSFEGYQTDWLWDWFHNECNEYNISPDSVIYATGNLIADEVYKKWADERGITNRLFIVGYSHFEIDVAMSTWNRLWNGNALPDFDNHITYKKNNEIKTYSCLNKRIRPHRVWFYYYLRESGLIPKGLVSMNKFDFHNWNWEARELNNETVNNLLEELPLLVYDKRNDELDDSFYIKRFNPEICLDSYISVVNEAQCGDSDNTVFISEKTFKPIATHHPFIIVGNRWSIKKMKELGYKTFDEYIDQSYDDLPTHERLQMIIESIRKIDNIEDKNEWFMKLRDDVEHNYKNLISKITDRPPDAFTKVLEYYNNFFNKDD